MNPVRTAKAIGNGFASRISAIAGNDPLAIGGLLYEVASVVAGGAAGRTGAAARGGVVAGEAGQFAALDARGVIGDGLTPNHMPQAALGFTSRANGGALVMEHSEHVLTRTYFGKGAVTARAEANHLFRDVLARDILDVRRIVGGKYNQGLRDLLQYYRTNFPDLMARQK
jgi:hypothetical protein